MPSILMVLIGWQIMIFHEWYTQYLPWHFECNGYGRILKTMQIFFFGIGNGNNNLQHSMGVVRWNEINTNILGRVLPLRRFFVYQRWNYAQPLC